MAKGNNAKQQVENIIRDAFGKNFLGIAEKKIYVKADDGNGEMVDIAITLTCPKVPFSSGNVEGGLDFNNMPAQGTATEFVPAEITPEETANIKKLIEKLGL